MRAVTRRNLLWTAAAAGATAAAVVEISRVTASAPAPPVVVPIHRILNSRARCTPGQIRGFWNRIWPQAVREFGSCGIQFQTSDGPGEIRRWAGNRPVFFGLRRGCLNLVLTDYIPMYWDCGRGLAGVTTMLHEGQHLSLIALAYAHPNEAPFVALNTCVHEFLHAFMQDIYVSDPTAFQSDERELRTDWLATELWLLRRGAAVRDSARVYASRLT